MIESRACAKPALPSVHTPSSSGPRWRRVAIISHSRASRSRIGNTWPAVRKPPMPHIRIACRGVASRQFDLDYHARAVSREAARVSTLLDAGRQPRERRPKSEARGECDGTRRAPQIVPGQSLREPAHGERADIRAAEADARPPDEREQAPRELEGTLVEHSPHKVVVKNDDPAAIFHQGADLLEQVAKLGEVVGSQVAETKTEFGHAAEDLPI